MIDMNNETKLTLLVDAAPSWSSIAIGGCGCMRLLDDGFGIDDILLASDLPSTVWVTVFWSTIVW